MNQAKVSGVIPSLDGIRAIAVLLVFFAHSGLEHIVPGGLGVTIFFVLSGYLIDQPHNLAGLTGHGKRFQT